LQDNAFCHSPNRRGGNNNNGGGGLSSDQKARVTLGD
jgi:hypothetical protein